jgi:GNAT superfamily N-acetyltransferase
VIRPGTAEDAAAVAGVQIASWQEAYKHLFTEEQLAAISLPDRIEFWRRFPPTVAEVEGEVVGFVTVGTAHDDPDADGELYAIYVLPDHWGTGVGRALMESGEARLQELGHSRVILWVWEDNPRARRFYEAAGWTADGLAKDAEFWGMSGRVVRYAKTL